MKKTKQFKPIRKGSGKKFELGGPVDGKETGRAKGYDGDWEKYRWRFLHHNPQCYACGKLKKKGSRHCVDHIVAHKGKIELFWDEKNYITLCKTCHAIVTGRFDKFVEPKTDKKLEWLARQREHFHVNVKVKVVSLPKNVLKLLS